MTTLASPEPLSKFPFHGIFSPVADQGVGLRSLSAFSFQSNPIAHQLSFLRGSVDKPVHESSSSGVQNPGQHRAFGSTSDDNHGQSYNGTPDNNEPSHHFSGGSPSLTLHLTPHRACRSMSRFNIPPSPSQTGGSPKTSCAIPTESVKSSRHGASSIGAGENDDLANESTLAQTKWQSYLTSVTDNYGLDYGRPDLDRALNNDHAAIDLDSALEMSDLHRHCDEHEPSRSSQMHKEDYGGYYISPVPIIIPRTLAPLPTTLLENPINLMYFHHFLNHTSRMLVPHDCDYNPFMSVLPSSMFLRETTSSSSSETDEPVAIGDPNLLNLLLAYSASHRARYLGHPEPANRIAHWVSDVFPALRVALESSHENITDGNLATAILLLSLKIVSPGTFEVPITWQSHLKLARDLFLARSEYIAYKNNQIGAFFARWLGYIDTMGALSSRHAGPPLMLYHSVLAACSGPDEHDEYSVDCFTGFTPRTGYFLIRLARLVQQCDNQRFDEFGNFRQGWHPSADMVMEAQAVLGNIDDLEARAHAHTGHHRGLEYQDMMAIEEAFRCAGLLHLHRRVLGSSVDSYPVKEALRKLVGALGRMQLGASAEVCSVFPLFTAGCESRDSTQQIQLLDRFFVLEKSGMKQVGLAIPRRIIAHR